MVGWAADLTWNRFVGHLCWMIELTTTDVAHGGYCVGRCDGVVIFVTGALPGEVVRVEVTGKRSKLWYARVVEVVEASPDRIAHIWPLAEGAGVGGADLGHVSLDGGRRWKAQVVAQQLLRVAHQAVDVQVEEAPFEGMPSAWRTRVVLQVDQAGRLGMYAAKSHQIVPVDGMPLAHEEIQQAIAEDLAAGMVRAAGGSISYVRASGSGLVRVGRGWAQGADMVEEIVRNSYGCWNYQVAAGGFWQVHRRAPDVLVEAVLDAVGDLTGPVYDLYAGAGLFTVPLAERAPVTAIEGAPQGVAALRHNTAGMEVEPRLGDVARTLTDYQTTGGVVVCDPPRSGAGAATVAQIVRLRPDKVVYVACDPTALARDIAIFAQAGYQLARLRSFDLFPYTHHVECLAVLVRSAHSQAGAVG